MDDFRDRVSAFLPGGVLHTADRMYRAGLFAAIQTSKFYEFMITRDQDGTQVVIAGGDESRREFSMEFALWPGELKRTITESDIKPDEDGEKFVFVCFDGRQTAGKRVEPRTVAVALYN